MNWIHIRTKLPDTPRTVFASNGEIIVTANYSVLFRGWVNITILSGKILFPKSITLWAEIDDLYKTLPGGEQ